MEHFHVIPAIRRPGPPYPPPYPQYVPPPAKAPPAHDGLAITSLILSILWFLGLGSLLAVIFGHRSRGESKRNGRSTSALATAGVVIGYIGLAGAALTIALIAAGVSASSSNLGAGSPPVVSTVGPATSSAPSSAPVTSAAPAPAAPQYTTAQQQAIDSAESYLSEGQGFSKAGLYQQLHSQAGEGFSASLARFAINHIRVNWKHQAVLSARSYMQTEPGWSYSGLVQQLDSPDGEQFTVAQAEYAAKAVGL
jgi:Domain of unknown function (DUF4190)/Host cell surface-exposed lipoprotein